MNGIARIFTRPRVLALCCALLCAAATSQEPPTPATAAPEGAPLAAPLPRVVLRTSLGDVTVEVDTLRAPATAQNFLRYVDARRFDGTTIYRAVRIGDD